MEKQIFTAQIAPLGGGYNGIALPENVLEAVQKAGLKRVKVTIGPTVLHVALFKIAELGTFVLFSKRAQKSLKIGPNSVFEVVLEVDDTEFQSPMPEELVEVLATDEDGERLFMALTDGRKRSLIYLILTVKSPDKRIERAFKIMEKLKMGISDPQLIFKKEDAF